MRTYQKYFVFRKLALPCIGFCTLTLPPSRSEKQQLWQIWLNCDFHACNMLTLHPSGEWFCHFLQCLSQPLVNEGHTSVSELNKHHIFWVNINCPSHWEECSSVNSFVGCCGCGWSASMPEQEIRVKEKESNIIMYSPPHKFLVSK